LSYTPRCHRNAFLEPDDWGPACTACALAPAPCCQP